MYHVQSLIVMEWQMMIFGSRIDFDPLNLEASIQLSLILVACCQKFSKDFILHLCLR